MKRSTNKSSPSQNFSMNFRNKKIETIETLGEKLQRHRQESHLTIEKISRKTGLNQKYLKFLESDSYDLLPPDVYTLNILKNYAKVLKLNPFSVSDIYKKEKLLFEKTRKKKIFSLLNLRQKITNFFLSPNFLKIFGITLISLSLLSYLGYEMTKIFSAPELIIISPRDNYLTDKSELLIQGKTEKEVEIKINERPLLSDINGQFELSLNLHKGLNIIKIGAKRKHSKENVIYRKIIVNEKN